MARTHFELPTSVPSEDRCDHAAPTTPGDGRLCGRARRLRRRKGDAEPDVIWDRWDRPGQVKAEPAQSRIDRQAIKDRKSCALIGSLDEGNGNACEVLWRTGAINGGVKQEVIQRIDGSVGEH